MVVISISPSYRALFLNLPIGKCPIIVEVIMPLKNILTIKSVVIVIFEMIQKSNFLIAINPYKIYPELYLHATHRFWRMKSAWIPLLEPDRRS